MPTPNPTIIGHAWAVSRIWDAIEHGRLAQSHLFVGPPSVGKRTLALATARELLSRSAKDRGRAAQLVDQHKHPDLFWIEAEGDGTNRSIKVETVRELLHSLSLAPVESTHRVVVICDAHLMTDSGKNALLKTLEEPNASVVLILTAPSVDQVLPTIASRCQVMTLRPASPQSIASALQQRGVEPAQAAFIARLSRGRVGWALRAIEDEDLLAERKERLDQLQTLLAADYTQRLLFAEKLARQDGPTVQATLEEWALFWRDVVQAMHAGTASGPNMTPLRNIDYLSLITTTAQTSHLATITALLRRLTQTAHFIQQNVNMRLALDVLMLNLPVA